MLVHLRRQIVLGGGFACLLAAPTSAASISGQVRYYSSGVPVAGVTIQLDGAVPASVQTNVAGQFEFGALGASAWQVTPSKQGAWQAGVSALDAAHAWQDALGSITLNPQQKLACDVDGSGALAATDTESILAFRVGLVSRFASAIDCDSDWVFVPVPAAAANQSLVEPQVTAPCQSGAIAYSPLVGDAVDQDFLAILVGDCTGNWPNESPTPTLTPTPTHSPVPPASPTPSATPTRAFDWPTITPVLVASGLTRPLYVTHAADGSGRIFIVEQGGEIHILRNGVVEPTPFLNIASRVTCCGERGLLGVAFPPGYVGKRYFYVNYTNSSGHTVIARYHLTADDDVADFASEEILLTIEQPFDNHNGGQISFSPTDGYLYVAVGDGGAGGDPLDSGQDGTSLLGKILRIDVEGSEEPYGIPGDNPFVGGPSRDEIWALGLRNPFRFSFDRSTGDLFIGDVGQGSREEIDFQPASSAGAENYGWRIMEGTLCFNPNPCDGSLFVPPLIEYSHSLGCSVTGGYVYRGSAFPRMQGVYVYGDFCSGRIWALKRDGGNWYDTLLIDTNFNISSFGEDEAGNIYLTHLGGAVYRLDDS